MSFCEARLVFADKPKKTDPDQVFLRMDYSQMAARALDLYLETQAHRQKLCDLFAVDKQAEYDIPWRDRAVELLIKKIRETIRNNRQLIIELLPIQSPQSASDELEKKKRKGERHIMRMIQGDASDTAPLVAELLMNKHTSMLDGATGVLNKKHFHERVVVEIKRADRTDQPLTLLLLDLDHFKRVNDTYGHAQGDQVILETVERIEGAIRATDIFGRVGGEEFAVLLTDTNLEGGVIAGQKLIDALRDRLYEQGIRVTASIGLSQHTTRAKNSVGNLLIREADRALYKVKQRGRNGVAVFNRKEGDIEIRYQPERRDMVAVK